jgi:octaprenyl-diphosphate synthase
VIDFVKASGGIEYAKNAMESYFKEALDILESFGDSNYKNSLRNLVNFTIQREK